MALSVGQQLGPYQILSVIGRGGMATVYRARQPQVNRDVAIKILPDMLAQNQQFVQRFRREAQTIASLEHIHVLPVYDFGQTDDLLYIVMRYIASGTVADKLKREGRLSLGETARIIKQVSSALDYAHRRGIVHRDLKPANVFLDPSGNTLLGDFGIARAAQAQATAHLTGNAVIGTPAYIAPEQGRGAPDVDGRADTYSLAIVAFELLTGRRPFEADSPLGLVMHHINTPLPDPRSFNPELPPAIHTVLQVAAAKDRNQRYSSAGAFGQAFENAAQGRGVNVQTTSSGGQRGSAAPETRVAPPRNVIPPPIIRAQPATPQPTPQPAPQTPQPYYAPQTPPPAAPANRGGWMRWLLGGSFAALVVVALAAVGAVWWFGIDVGQLADELLVMSGLQPVAPLEGPSIEVLSPANTNFVELRDASQPVTIQAVSSAPIGMAYTLFEVNGELVAVNDVVEVDGAGNRAPQQISVFVWQPPDVPGDYELRLVAVAADSQETDARITFRVP